MPISRAVFRQVSQLIPPLDGTLHKGQSGRVGVLGGALDYTGAPFFAAMSALRIGADLSHVICSPTAAGAIKSYSPDLIVHPILRETTSLDTVKPELQSILSRLQVLIVGPGLGRETYMQHYAKMAICLARGLGMYIVLDADALFIVGRESNIIQGYSRAILTPNIVEFQRLIEQLSIDPAVPKNSQARFVSKMLGGVTILQKGRIDVIVADTTGKEADLMASQIQDLNHKAEAFDAFAEVDIEGGLKRFGGQGDVLSGCVGTFLAWGRCYEDGVFGDRTLPASRIPFLSAIGGSMVTRVASRRAFYQQRRGTVTQDMLQELSRAFVEIEVYFQKSQQSNENI